MPCPTCKQPVVNGRSEFRPFCSQRCKLVDLGRWLDGDYAIPGEPASDDELAADVGHPVAPPGRADTRRHRDN